jgi:H+/Cl- antiporter ClcA
MAAIKGSPFGLRMVVATVLTGVAAGLSGMGISFVLHLVQHVSFGYTENTFLIGVERASDARRILAVGGGGVIVGVGWWAQRRWISTPVSLARSLADPTVPLPIPATTIDSLLQVVAVGAGASLGREGAPRQVGAALGGWIATRAGLTPAQRRTLLACGAGAGLAAVYNVPLGGAFFTLEVLLVSMAIADIVPALLTSMIATVTAWPLVTDQPTYRLAAPPLTAPLVVWSIAIGPVAALAGLAFVRLMTLARAYAPTGWRSVAAVMVVFTALGASAIAYPQLLGNGKGLAEVAFAGSLALGIAVVLAVLKTVATAACLASGAIGGLLTPSFAVGAALGAFAGGVWNLIWPGGAIAGYTLVGAGALLAVTQRAALTSIVLTTEFTHATQNIIAPLVLAVAVAMVSSIGLRRLRQRIVANWPTLSVGRAPSIVAVTSDSSSSTPPP